MLISGLEFVHFANVVDVPFLDNSFHTKSGTNNLAHKSDQSDPIGRLAGLLPLLFHLAFMFIFT